MFPMSAKVLRSFAYGLMASAMICGAVYFFGSSDSGEAEAVAAPSEESMKETLQESGYLVLTEKELNERIAASGQETENVEKPEAEEAPVTKTIVTVSSGMTSIDVGDALVKGGLVEDAFAFSKEVEKRGVAGGLRLGTFELDSTMSLDQMIGILFK